MSVGIILFMVGLVPWTIGGFISMITKPDVHNRHYRALFDPRRPPANERNNFNDFLDAHFNNTKSRWWCLIGLSLCMVGLGLSHIGF